MTTVKGQRSKVNPSTGKSTRVDFQVFYLASGTGVQINPGNFRVTPGRLPGPGIDTRSNINPVYLELNNYLII